MIVLFKQKMDGFKINSSFSRNKGRLTPVGADLPSAGGNAAIFAKVRPGSGTFGARTGRLLTPPLGFIKKYIIEYIPVKSKKTICIFE